ncbi:MAG: UvrD-helicase domain-containing protein [Candidatus Aminicenantes bacterium]|nr:UvrD-helicase domain-containing protein [Candidatus Aminicenantes bacterium]
MDWAERERIRRDLDRTFLVEAGAGSGKTQSLADRMIALLATGRARIDTLAAVTFTRKAAAELRGRFQVELEKALRDDGQGAWGAAEKARLSDALRNLEQGFIGTIHSFCARLLRERPLEAGVDPDFVEIEDIDDDLFRERCWHDYLNLARQEDDARVSALEEVGVLPDDLKEAFEALSLYPEVDPCPGTSALPDFAQVRERLDAYLDSVRSHLPDSRPEGGWDDLQTAHLRCLVRRRTIGLAEPRELAETLDLLDKNLRKVDKRWPSKDLAKKIEAKWRTFRADVAAPALRLWREARHDRVLAFLRPAAEFYAARRRERWQLNFQDLLLTAARLLRENPEVRRYFRRRFARILVDEFQDTDPVQAEILLYITGSDPQEKDWRKLVPRPGSLFLVGDPKQSIYRFRRADIDIYNLVKRRVEGEGGGEVLRLTANFRSLDCIAAWVNPIFAGLFPGAEDGRDATQARFAPLEPFREGCAAAFSGVFRIELDAVSRHKEDDIAEQDAAAIADFIAWSCAGNLKLDAGEGRARPAEPSDFLVLFRYKKTMDTYARALEDRGVPFEISGSDAFREAEEVREIQCLVHALSDPEDEVSTVAVVRGLFFGLSDQDLLDFHGLGGRFCCLDRQRFEPRAGRREEAAARRVARALDKLRIWREWTRSFPATAALERVLEDAGLVPYLASSAMGSSRAGNVVKLLELLRGREREGWTSFADLADFMDEVVEVGDVEEMSLTPGRRSAVRLMNLHRAKGLEARVVFLAQPVGMKEHEPDHHISRMAGDGADSGGRGYFTFSKSEGWSKKVISQPAGWAAKAEEERKYLRAEEERLMYVAATRARDLLVVSVYQGTIEAKEAWSALNTAARELPRLELPPSVRKPGRGKAKVGRDETKKTAEFIRSRVTTAVKASYVHEAVTSVAAADRAGPAWPAGGFGMKWGSVVHAVLNALGKEAAAAGGWVSPDEAKLERTVANAAGAVELEETEVPAVADLIRSILRSDFWRRVMAAERRFFEVPFHVRVDPQSAEHRRFGAPAGLPLFLAGAIDLAFYEGDGWVIADYKTDRLAEDLETAGVEAVKKSLKAQVDRYAPQVETYARYWERITREKVKEAGLYFTSIDHWFRLLP